MALGGCRSSPHFRPTFVCRSRIPLRAENGTPVWCLRHSGIDQESDIHNIDIWIKPLVYYDISWKYICTYITIVLQQQQQRQQQRWITRLGFAPNSRFWFSMRSSKNSVLVSVDELDNAENWVQAENDVEKIIEQAIQNVPVRKIRLNLENAKKQFLLMSQLVKRRNSTIRQVRWWVLWEV